MAQESRPGTSPFSPALVPLPQSARSEQLAQLAREEHWKELRDIAEKRVQAVPGDVAAFYWLGEARLHLDNPIGAIQALRSAERLGLNTEFSHESLGVAYSAVYQYRLFEEQMKKAIGIDSRAARPWYYLGRYYESVRGDAAGALKLFSKARDLDAEDPQTWVHMASCLETLDQPEEAQRAYTTALRLAEKKGERLSLAYQGLARLSMETAPERALDFAEKAVQMEPQTDANHLVLAKVDERLGRVPEAVKELQEAIRLNSTNIVPHQILANLYFRLGRKDAGQAELRIIREISEVYGVR
jgi:tetratricopeptide (TPR) repeat protein